MLDDDFTFSQSSNSGPVPLERQHPLPDRRTVTVSVEDLERALTNAVRRGMNDTIKTVTSEESVKAFWSRGFGELRDHSRAHVRDGVGGAVIRWGAGILAAAGLTLYFKFGPYK